MPPRREMSVVLQVFGHKPKCWVHEHVDLMVALDEKSADLLFQHPAINQTG